MPSPPPDSRANAEAQIVARAGHDMRQPLHALALFHAALKRRAGDEQTQAIVARAEQAGAALSRVMLSVLALAQLNAASDALPLAAIRLEDIFGALREELTPDFQASGAALALEGGGAATTEPEGLKAILRPLLLLAADSAGPVRLAGGGDGALAIELSWGAPLAEDVAALLAGDFARAASTPRTARNGLDLALLVAARQAEALGIVIEPTRADGQTRLRLLLPAA
jgi:light-regulated signal transduction histidine kinase (bacteriophytochrome)